MLIHVDRESRTPLYLQIRNQIRDMIFSGMLPPGFRLPPERKLAEALNVNRSTVLNAYHELKADQLIESRVGCGTLVLEPGSAACEPNATFVSPEPIHWRQLFSGTSSRQQNPLLQDLMQLLHRRQDVISFSLGIPAVELYPSAVFQDLQSEVLRKYGQAALCFLPTEGYYPLRESISQLMRKRGAAVSPEETLVLSGSQQGIDLIARTFIDPGDVILVEEPSFFCAVQVFRSAGARVIGVPIDENGMRTDLLESFLARHKPKFIYTIPNFQNPTGTVMNLQRRRQLLNLAYSYRTPILEDDAYGELRYEGQYIPSLKALDQHGYVIYLNTFSKTLSPGIRLGWLAAARPVIHQIVMAKQLNDIHSNSVAQFVVDSFLRRGLFEQHLQKICREYIKRRDIMMAALDKSRLHGIGWDAPAGGLYLWCRLTEQLNKSTVLLMRAIDQGVTFVPGEAFYLEEQGSPHIRLNFALQPEGVIEEGVKRLAKALKEAQVSTGGQKIEPKAQTNPLF